MRKPARSKPRSKSQIVVAARLAAHVELVQQPSGGLAVDVGSQILGLGALSPGAVRRAQKLVAGLPFRFSLGQTGNSGDDIAPLLRRLARHGLLEYDIRRGGIDQVVIEPQTADYWPAPSRLAAADAVALSRFAYLRRRGNDTVLESPRAGALFRICEPGVAAMLVALSTPRSVKELRREVGYPGDTLLALLLDAGILFSPDLDTQDSPRLSEGDDALAMWDFHDLLFHARTTEGRQANPLGGTYPYAGVIEPLPAVRPPWPGKTIDLKPHAPPESLSPVGRLLRARHSARNFDAQHPIALDELARFLDGAARVQARWHSTIDVSGGPMVSYASRPYPSGGSAYELELYLSVAQCSGLARGFYHYDADRHALVAIDAQEQDLQTILHGAAFAMGAEAPPQILITVAARFGRVAWKYSSIAYALVQKDAGVLLQTLYLMATDLGLGGCAVGSTNVELFAKMTGLAFHVEGPVCHFALGRSAV